MTSENPPPILVLGMHRSGTSLVAQILHAMGVHVGEPETLLPPDFFNPTGYWEYVEALQIDRDIFKELRASRSDVAGIDIGRLSEARRAELVTRMRHVVQTLQPHAPFLLKDPRISLLFPLWREALGRPACVIPWREPAAVSRSLATRDKQPRVISLALWEHYNCTILRDTIETPRTLVSYEELLAEPIKVVGALHDQLCGFGVPRLTVPSEERLRQIVDVDLNRSGRDLEAERRLTTVAQRDLARALKTGSALLETAAATSPASLELLAVFSTMEIEKKALQRRARHLGALLKGMLDPHS
jgi:hypothetical protein